MAKQLSWGFYLYMVVVLLALAATYFSEMPHSHFDDWFFVPALWIGVVLTLTSFFKKNLRFWADIFLATIFTIHLVVIWVHFFFVGA